MKRRIYVKQSVVYDPKDLHKNLRETKLYKYLSEPKSVRGLLGRVETFLHQIGVEHITYSRYDSEQHISTVPARLHDEYLVQNLFQYDWAHKLNKCYTHPRFYGDIRRLFIESFRLESEAGFLAEDALSRFDDDLRANNEILRIMHNQRFNEYFLLPGLSGVGNANYAVSLCSTGVSADDFRARIQPLAPVLRLMAKIIDDLLCFQHHFIGEITPPQRHSNEIVVPNLTATEMSVMADLKKGMKATDIAKVRNRSVDTIRTHIKRIKRKIGGDTLIEVINNAHAYGLHQVES